MGLGFGRKWRRACRLQQRQRRHLGAGSLEQLASWAALAGHTGLAFDMRLRDPVSAAAARAAARRVAA